MFIGRAEENVRSKPSTDISSTAAYEILAGFSSPPTVSPLYHCLPEMTGVCPRCLRGFSVMPATSIERGFSLKREYRDIFPC